MTSYERGKTAALQKHALLGTLALGAGMHLGANALIKAFRRSDMGKRFQASQMASGFNHALEGRKVNPVARNIGTFLIGPESMVPYDVGHRLGRELAPMDYFARRNHLEEMRSAIENTKHVAHAPVVGEMPHAIERILGGQKGFMEKIPHTVDMDAAPTRGQQLLSAGAAAGAIAAAPDMAIHMGLNATRNGIGRSIFSKFIREKMPGFDRRFPQVSKFLDGRAFIKNNLRTGYYQGMPDMAEELAYDYGLSPAALDSRRVGHALRREFETAANTGQVRPALGIADALAGTALDIPRVEDAVRQRAGAVLQPRFLEALRRAQEKYPLAQNNDEMSPTLHQG